VLVITYQLIDFSHEKINFQVYHTNLINQSFESGNCLLHYAVIFKKPDIVKILLYEFLAIQVARNSTGFTPFHLACKYGYFYIVRIFLEFSYICVDIPSINKVYPLSSALRNRHYPISKYLISKGANFDVLNNYDKRILSRIYSSREYDYISLINSRNTYISYENEEPEYSSTVFIYEKNVSVKPCKEIIDAIVKISIDKNENCPISLEPLKKESVVLTSCFHVFNKEPADIWFNTNSICPTCRTTCVLWNTMES
jgi:ankyrin repeat protein